jgi:type II secretory pathway pseudopilin PulG
MKKSGFSLLEIIIAVGLAAAFLPVIVRLFSLSLQSSIQGEIYSQAHAHAQETMEAIFWLKSQNNADWDWVTTPANTDINLGEHYQPVYTGSEWQLGGKTTNPTPDGKYTKKVAIEEVRRCGSVICNEEWAPVHTHSRKITVYVSWSDRGYDHEVRLDSYVTRY